MITIDQIRSVHIELSTLCNARCPQCARNVYGYPHNNGYPEINLSLDSVRKIFLPAFLQQLNQITVCGNFGDFILNPDGIDIVRYWKSINPNIGINILTNGSGRSKVFWEELADLKAIVIFGIDGLEDTHKLYRIDTDWQKIMKNAQYFIQKGGTAVWEMTEFNHNKHQIKDCKDLAKKMGFSSYKLRTHSRNQGPIFDRSGQFVRWLEGPRPGRRTDIKSHLFEKKSAKITPTFVSNKPLKINCDTQQRNEIYIAANGQVFPCCYMGFYPGSYADAPWRLYANNQVLEMMNGQNNNALEVGLESAISWFSNVEKRWQAEFGSTQRSYFCDYHCGQQLISTVEQCNFDNQNT